MKYQFFILLFIFSLSIHLFESDNLSRYLSTKTITKEVLKNEILNRMERVDELRVMKELAMELGIKDVYLFGGSAAAWAHYVYWDLEREAGMGSYHDSRFDYDYTSIFRANQDMDIVVDVDEDNQHLVSEFEKILQERFQHFQGNKSAWEVRPLRFSYGVKDQILDNPDFLAQNSDSHSTGLISVTNNDEIGIRDFKQWNKRNNHFFDDVYKRELHLYRDAEAHKSTKRFREGLNPEIFSVIRYLTKAFQYELKMDRESLISIKEIIKAFDPRSSLKSSYARTWVEKNGKKLYQNAIDIEFAYKTMKELNLIKSLISIDDGIHNEDTLSWWLNKMPLPTKPLGKYQKGKSAEDLGINIVAHETRSFAAYESITKSHSGLANVFISRGHAAGELAVHGDGFYTRIGRKGAVGSGLTIRFKVDPNAIEGQDFKQSGDYVIILNKEIIEVIPESLNITTLQYFKSVVSGELIFDHSDKGVEEKVKRKIQLQMSNLEQEEVDEIADIIKGYIKEHEENSSQTILKKWFEVPGAYHYSDIVEMLKPYENFNSFLIENYLGDSRFEKDEVFLNSLISNDQSNRVELFKKVFATKKWSNSFKLLKPLFKEKRYLKLTADFLVGHPDWDIPKEWVEEIIESDIDLMKLISNGL